MTTLVTGATGLVGGEAARLLSAGGQPVRALVRVQTDAVRLQRAGIDIVRGDLDDRSSLRRAVEEINSVILVSPATPDMVRQQCNLIDVLAEVHGGNTDDGPCGRSSPRIVKISGFMTSADSASQSGRWHAQIEAHIEKRGMQATCLRPLFFMQNLLRLQPHALTAGEIALPVAEGRIAMVDARDLSAVAVACARDDSHAGRCYPVTGPQALAFSDVAEQLSAVLGTTVRHTYVDPEQMRLRLEALHTPNWRIEVVLEFYAGFQAGLAQELSSTVAELCGRTPYSLRQFIYEHRDILNAQT